MLSRISVSSQCPSFVSSWRHFSEAAACVFTNTTKNTIVTTTNKASGIVLISHACEGEATLASETSGVEEGLVRTVYELVRKKSLSYL